MGHRTGLPPRTSLLQPRPSPSTSLGRAQWGPQPTRSPQPPHSHDCQSSLSGPTARIVPTGASSRAQENVLEQRKRLNVLPR